MYLDVYVERFTRRTDGARRARGTPLGSLAVGVVEAPKTERARAGVRFNAVNGNGSTFLAPVTAWPTTTLTMMLYNGDPKKTYFIDSAFAFLASGTPDVGGALIACVTDVAQALNPTPYANTVVGNLSGKGSATAAKTAGGSKAVFANNITLAGDTPAWFMVDCKPQVSATAKIAASCFQGNLDGGVALPPGYGLGLSVLAGAGTTPLYGFGVVWDEHDTDLET